MKWLNIAGLVLQFISFWLAAPELLGQSTLRRFESGLKKLIASIPVIIVWVVVLSYGLTFTITGILNGIEAGKNGNVSYTHYLVPMAICTSLYFVFIIFYKKIKIFLEKRVAQPLVERLVNNNETRKNSLIAGAVLFTVGFLMQLIVLLFT